MSIDPLALGMGHLGIMALKKADIEPVKLQQEEEVVAVTTSTVSYGGSPFPLTFEQIPGANGRPAYWKEKTNE